ncbi:MAG TPA: N-acetylmuramoyl-L-alanine amidase [Myxococcota bacterium]|nr:N-acetylmuramoyl-L-alanine amidase [Myxococcota bacterium]
MLISAFLASAAATTYGPAFEQAAEEFQVPEPLLVALAYEASRIDPDAASAWGGYGMFDFREDDESFGPGIERASVLLDTSPDDLMVDPVLQIRGAAALLAWHGDGEDVGDLEAWADPIRAFSGRQEPELQRMFVEYIYELVDQGIYTEEARVLPQGIDFAEVVVPAPPADYAGAYQFVAASSSNYTNSSRSSSDIRYIVIHTVQGSYSGCISWFQNSAASVSAHYVVRSSDGQVTQMVWEEDTAWHAGNWSYNQASVGIEHEGYVDAPDTWYTDAMYESSAALSADIIDRTAVVADRSHVIAHSEIPGATHTDPGSGWDWDRYMDLIDGGGGTTTPSAELLGVIADEDIYEGDRLAGVTVVLDQTGETTTTDGDGYYRFTELGAGTWSVTVTASGFEDGSCSKDITTSSAQWWCSVALDPAEEEEEPVDTGEPQQDDTGVEQAPRHNGGGDGQRDHGIGEPGPKKRLGGCSTAPAPAGLALLALLLHRRRRCSPSS